MKAAERLRVPGLSSGERAERAMRRFALKSAPGRVKAVLDRLRPAMQARYAETARDQVLVDDACRAVLVAHGVERALYSSYLCFGRAVWGRWRRLGGRTLANELALVRMRWEAEGLDADLLPIVEQAVVEELSAQGSEDSRVQGVEDRQG